MEGSGDSRLRVFDGYWDEENLCGQRGEGLLLDHLHFWGSYSVVATALDPFRRGMRIARRSASARSVAYAPGFLIEGTRKPGVRLAGAIMGHCAWVLPPTGIGRKPANQSG